MFCCSKPQRDTNNNLPEEASAAKNSNLVVAALAEATPAAFVEGSDPLHNESIPSVFKQLHGKVFCNKSTDVLACGIDKFHDAFLYQNAKSVTAVEQDPNSPFKGQENHEKDGTSFKFVHSSLEDYAETSEN